MRILIIYIIIIANYPVLGQHSTYYPDMFTVFFNHQPLFNPAFQYDTGRVVLAGGIKARTGAFKNVATFYTSFERIFNRRNNSSHTIRLLFYDEKEGPYIQKPRGYLNYAAGVFLSPYTFLSAGASIGLVQISFVAPSSSASGVATLPDANVGLYLRSRYIRIGVSSMQLLDNSSRPINGSVKLGRYYNFFLMTEKGLSYAWKLKAAGQYRLLPDNRDHLDTALLLCFKEAFQFGASARYRLGLSFFVSFHANTGNSVVSFNFAYNTPFFSSISALNNSFEIAPYYLLK